MSPTNSGHTKYAYQTKEAFFTEEPLASYRDREGDIKVSLRDEKYVDLSFKDSDVQSRLDITNPNRPALKYIQSMLLGPLFFHKESDLSTILIIGFGGGSLAKYYTDFYGNKSKIIVDFRPILFDVAQEHFQYKPDSNTLLVPGDAALFVKKARVKKSKFDLINIDIFMEGPSDLQMQSYFWSDVGSILSPKGVCVTNVWRGDYEDKYQKILQHHKDNFGTVFEVVNSETNQVAMYGSNLPFEFLAHNNLDIKAVEMAGLSAVDFPLHLRNIRRLK